MSQPWRANKRRADSADPSSRQSGYAPGKVNKQRENAGPLTLVWAIGMAHGASGSLIGRWRTSTGKQQSCLRLGSAENMSGSHLAESHNRQPRTPGGRQGSICDMEAARPLDSNSTRLALWLGILPHPPRPLAACPLAQ